MPRTRRRTPRTEDDADPRPRAGGLLARATVTTTTTATAVQLYICILERYCHSWYSCTILLWDRQYYNSRISDIVRNIINCHIDAWKYFEKTNSLYRYCVIYFNLLSIGMHALEYCRMYDRCKSTSWDVLDSALWARSAQIVRALWNN